jgi:hypothetical protein
MTDSQYLNKALDFIVEQEKENDYICTRMLEIPEEYEVCASDCQNLNIICVLRFLKRYKNEVM